LAPSPRCPAAAQAAVGEAKVTPSVAGVTWHKISLLHGWKVASSLAFGTRAPSWAVRGGIVYLDGGLQAPATLGSRVFGVLPAPVRTARTARTQYINVVLASNALTTTHVTIAPNGVMYLAGNVTALSFSSLNGISFPATATARHKLTLINGWKSGAVSTGSSNPAYSLTSGVVCLSGTTHPSTTSFYATFTSLPRAVRPRYNLWFYADVNNAAGGVIGIEHAGPAFAEAMPASNPVQMASLGSICYPVNS
jgi:hypothetical protein